MERDIKSTGGRDSSDKLVTNLLFQQNDINPCIYKDFFDDLDLEQHGDDFQACGVTRSLENLTEEFKRHFLVQKAEIASLNPDIRTNSFSQTSHFCGWNFGWHVELDERYVKSSLDAMAMNHCKTMATPGSRGRKGTSRVPISFWNLSLYERTTLRHCFQCEANRERGSWTHHSFKDKS